MLDYEIRRATAIGGISSRVVLDPTAGGGSIPFEATRVGVDVYANDLNPVATTILRQTVKVPLELGLESPCL